MSVLTLFLPVRDDGLACPDEWRFTMSEDWLAKAGAAEAALEGDEVIVDPDWRERFPALYAFMTRTTTPTGLPRQVCRVSVFAEGGEWKCSLSDPNTEHTMYRTCASPECAWLILDEALRSGRPDWRPWKANRNGTRRK